MDKNPRKPLNVLRVVREVFRDWFALLMVLIGVTKAFGPVTKILPNEWRQWFDTGIPFFCYLVAALALRNWYLLRKLHSWLRDLNPWLVAMVLVLSVLVLKTIVALKEQPPPVSLKNEPIPILFDSARGQVFNSWEARFSPHRKRIRAFGTPEDPNNWCITDHGLQASFSYSVNMEVASSEGASSGGYITFYNTPCNRRVYRKLAFFCKIIETCSPADVGIRLAVDDDQPDKNERVTYEFPSLRKKGPVGPDFQRFEIYFAEFQRGSSLAIKAPLSRGVDENTINKIVFYVTNEIVRSCPKNTIVIRDVRFEP